MHKGQQTKVAASVIRCHRHSKKAFCGYPARMALIAASVQRQFKNLFLLSNKKLFCACQLLDECCVQNGSLIAEFPFEIPLTVRSSGHARPTLLHTPLSSDAPHPADRP